MANVTVSGSGEPPNITVTQASAGTTVKVNADADGVVQIGTGDTQSTHVVTTTDGAVQVSSGIQRGPRGPAGREGPQGPQGDPGPVMILDRDTVPDVPTEAVHPYIRFERDVDGDVQNIYLGTAD